MDAESVAKEIADWLKNESAPEGEWITCRDVLEELPPGWTYDKVYKMMVRKAERGLLEKTKRGKVLYFRLKK